MAYVGGTGGRVAGDIIGGPIGEIFPKMFRKSHTPGASLDKAQAAFAAELLAQSRGPRATYFNQLTEALQAGRASGRIPQTQYMVEGAKRKASDTQQQVLENAAANNLRGTEAVKRTGAARTAGAIGVGLTPTDVVTQYLLAAPGAVLGQAQQQVAQPLSGLAELTAQKYLRSLQAEGEIGQGIGASLGALAGAYIGKQHYGDGSPPSSPSPGLPPGGGYSNPNLSVADGMQLSL